jgi:hypothetical protein
MKMTKRERTLLILLITVIAAIVLVLAFIIPTNVETNSTRERIERLNGDIAEAIDAERVYGLMLAQMDEAGERHAEVTAIISDDLDDSQALRVLHGVLSPHTSDISLTFPDGGRRSLDMAETMTLLPIDARITVPSYSALRNVLTQLTLENSGCAVFDLSYREIGDGALSVTMRIQFLISKSEAS